MGGTGCGSEQPEITLTAIDCPVDEIDISVTITKRRDPSRTTTTAKITVTCMGEPVNEAEINVNFWDLFTKKDKTDENGELTVSQVTGADTTGLEVTVTVEGEDGEREVVVKPVPE
jgi:hypothetical protein